MKTGRTEDKGTRRVSANMDGGCAGETGFPASSNDTCNRQYATLSNFLEDFLDGYVARTQGGDDAGDAEGCTARYLLDRYGLTLTPGDAARELHQSPQHVRALCREGLIPATLVGRRWHISSVKLGQMLDEGAVMH